MEKTAFEQALHMLREKSPKRNFAQSVDLVISLKDIDPKKATPIDFYTELPFGTGRQVKVCALVGAEMITAAKQHCDLAIVNDDFKQYDKKKQKQLANEFDYFVAQANLMQEIAKVFGRVLGQKGKMPNPKAGCVVPPNANLQNLVTKLRKTVRVRMRNELAVKSKLGNESMKDGEIAENAHVIFNQLVHLLPNEQHNVRHVMLKFTMSPTVKVGEKATEVRA